MSYMSIAGITSFTIMHINNTATSSSDQFGLPNTSQGMIYLTNTHTHTHACIRTINFQFLKAHPPHRSMHISRRRKLKLNKICWIQLGQSEQQHQMYVMQTVMK
eukprot:GHVL01000353.1.p1 GENE.GHVL01000353.1~~GHVL01000353.1.p1  ORF type:complete len:104 (+),score=11.53 GHVL01000353.1:472-783(+)